MKHLAASAAATAASGIQRGGALDAHLKVRRGREFELDLPLCVEPGSTVALVGPNGAGKTTTVRALAGLEPLEAGWIRLGGQTWDEPAKEQFAPAERRAVGVVFQDHLLFPHLTVFENVAFGPRSQGARRDLATHRAYEWLDVFGLTDLADRPPSALSGGQAQQVALARAWATQPSLLLLDEPLAALDVRRRADLRRVLGRHLESFEGPRVLVTHDPREAFLLADEVIVLEDGRRVQSGTPTQLRSSPETSYVAEFVGTNLFEGTVRDGGVVEIDGFPVRVADKTAKDAVLVEIHPRAVSLYLDEPVGSPRNTWQTSVVGIEEGSHTLRVNLGAPVPLSVEITAEARGALGLDVGKTVWVAIKATEIQTRVR